MERDSCREEWHVCGQHDNSLRDKKEEEQGGKRKEGRGGKGRGEERRAELNVLSTPIVPMLQRLRHEEQSLQPASSA